VLWLTGQAAGGEENSIVSSLCQCDGTVTTVGVCLAPGGWQTTDHFSDTCSNIDDIYNHALMFIGGFLAMVIPFTMMYGSVTRNGTLLLRRFADENEKKDHEFEEVVEVASPIASPTHSGADGEEEEDMPVEPDTPPAVTKEVNTTVEL